MSTRTERLALEVVSEVADAIRDLGSIESAAEGAAGALGKLSDINEAAGQGLDRVTSAADSLDGTMAAATGAVGALGSGLELVGAEGAAEQLAKVGLATDFLSGVGQTAALAVQAQAGATKALEVAQKAANIAMRANPIGLVVTAIVLLVAGLVLAYNKSETFRNIVQAAGRTAKAAFDSVATAIGTVVTWARDRVGPAFDVVKTLVVRYLAAPKAAIEDVTEVIKDVIKWAGDIPAKFGALKDKAVEIAAPLLAPFTAVKEALQWIADKIANLKMPDWLDKIPLVGNSRASAADDLFGSRGGSTTTTTAAVPSVSIVIQGALDPYAVAVQIRDLLARYNVAVS